MLRYHVVVGNISPMLMNPMTDKTLTMLRERKRKQPKTDWPIEEEARTKLFATPNGNLAIPSTNLLACLVNAGRKVKQGKVQLSTAETSMVPALITIEQDYLLLNGNGTGIKYNPPYVPDKRRGCNPADGVAVCLVRPKFPHWGFECTIEIDDTEINLEAVRKLFEQAGKFVGLGDFRPQKRGPFGRFELLSLNQLKGEDQPIGDEPTDGPYLDLHEVKDEPEPEPEREAKPRGRRKAAKTMEENLQSGGAKAHSS
jgi:hypothetical protein